MVPKRISRIAPRSYSPETKPRSDNCKKNKKWYLEENRLCLAVIAIVIVFVYVKINGSIWY